MSIESEIATGRAKMTVHGPERAETLPSDWLGQPRGLTVLFLTDMWEQFSFFGMRTLLVYYMTTQLLISQDVSSLIYGAYAAGAYSTPLLGGVLADFWLGRRRAVVLGGLIMAAGHFMMVFPTLFYAALCTIAVGNGLFVPTLPSQVNDLYAPADPRRKSAYNIYYAGTNIGAALSAISCGWVGQRYGWGYGFGLAGIGMLTGLLIYLFGTPYLPSQSPTRSLRKSQQPVTRQFSKDDRQRMALLITIMLIVVIFRGAYEQIGNTIALWAETGIDKRFLFGWSIPMTWFQAVNPLFIVLLTPVVVSWWTSLAQRQREPSSLVKMAIGAAIVGTAYVMAAGVAHWSAETGTQASWLWLVAFLIILTVGELYILPVGLGLFARLAPHCMPAFTLALWFSAIFAGSLFAGYIGSYWEAIGHGEFFAIVSACALTPALLFLVLNKSARKLEEKAESVPEALDYER